MTTDEKSTDTQFQQIGWPSIRLVVTYSLYLLCTVSVALAGSACTIGNDDENVVATPPTSISFEVLLTSGLSTAQVLDLLMEVWIHDLNDSPFDNGSRDSDQVDTAALIVPRTVVRNRASTEDQMEDRLTFDVDLENNISAFQPAIISCFRSCCFRRARAWSQRLSLDRGRSPYRWPLGKP